MPTYATAKAALAVARRTSPGRVPIDPIRHLANRFGFGASGPSSTTDPDAWFARQLALAALYPAYAGVSGLTREFPTLPLEPPQVRAWLKTNIGNEWMLDACTHLEAATLALQAWSPAQLLESVVDAFSNILNVANYQPATWCARSSYDRTVIRAHAMGSYSDMLVASSKHPAMLIYLDNAHSFRAAPIENYGREILEMHTVGRGAGYTQEDVVNSARLLTGRTVNFANTTYVYNMNQRWTGRAQVLDFVDANSDARGGEAVGDRYVRYLANHPSTARNLANRLCVRFVSDAPPQALVDNVAKAYLDNGTQIVPMLQTIVRSSEFWASAGAKVRRPAENLIATVRATRTRPGANLGNSGRLLGQLSAVVGQRPLSWAAPNGYPDTAAAWLTAGTLAEQWQIHWKLSNGAYGSALARPPLTSYVGSKTPKTVAAALQAMSHSLLGQALSTADQRTLLTYLGETATHAYTRSALPRQLGAVAAILLHGPRHTLR